MKSKSMFWTVCSQTALFCLLLICLQDGFFLIEDAVFRLPLEEHCFSMQRSVLQELFIASVESKYEWNKYVV